MKEEELKKEIERLNLEWKSGFLSGQLAERERCLKMIEQKLKFCNCYLKQDNEEVKKRMVILFIQILNDMKEELTKKVSEETK